MGYQDSGLYIGHPIHCELCDPIPVPYSIAHVLLHLLVNYPTTWHLGIIKASCIVVSGNIFINSSGASELTLSREVLTEQHGKAEAFGKEQPAYGRPSKFKVQDLGSPLSKHL